MPASVHGMIKYAASGLLGRIGRQGEIRDRTTEGQHFRIAGLNLLTAIIIFWNTKQLGHALKQRNQALYAPSGSKRQDFKIPVMIAEKKPIGAENVPKFKKYGTQN